VTQAVFVALCGQLGYDAARGGVAGFVAPATRARASDGVRSGGRHLQLLRRWHETAPAGASPATPLQNFSTKQRTERVRVALTELSEREREVLELAYFQDLTQSEIADRLGAPLGSVKSWARRGLLSL